MADYLPRPPGLSAGGPSAAPEPERSETKPPLSDDQIEAILADFKQKDDQRRPPGSGFDGQFAFVFNPEVIPRSLFVLAGVLLISNGMEGMRVRAESSTSLIALNINHRGGQSLGLGFAVLAVAVMPYRSGHQGRS